MVLDEWELMGKKDTHTVNVIYGYFCFGEMVAGSLSHFIFSKLVNYPSLKS